MLGYLDDFFCQLEGKTCVRPFAAGNTKKNHKRSQESLAGIGRGTRLIKALLGTDEGLNGPWLNNKEQFRKQLLNDIQTMLFGKWEKPWKDTIVTNSECKRLTFRSINGRPYTDPFNIIMLEARTKTSPYFITPAEVKKRGGTITNKDYITIISGWVALVKEGEQFRIAKKDEKDEADLFVPKPYHVISTDFVTGIKVPDFHTTKFEKVELIDYVESFVNELKKKGRLPKIYYDQKDMCFYIPAKDEIHLVNVNQFNYIEGYYNTLLHEIIHSTMNPARCGRGKLLKDNDRRANYAAEELVAEMGATILSAELFTDYKRQNSIVYLKGWLDEAKRRSGKNDDEILLEAYGYAVDAVDYLIRDIDLDSLLPDSLKERAANEVQKDNKNKTGRNGKKKEATAPGDNKKGDSNVAETQTGLEGIHDTNKLFNHELVLLQKGKLSKNHIFRLGIPSDNLIAAGIDKLPIELRAKTLIQKSSKDYKGSHPFLLSEIINLPSALAHPVAIFQSLKHANSKVILTELQSNQVNFVAAIEIARLIKRKGKTIMINDIRSIYPKDYVKDILKWIYFHNLLVWVDKEKALNWLSKLHCTAEVANLVKGCANIIQNFQNPISNRPDSKHNGLGLTSFSKNIKVNTYKLKGDLGKFLGEYDRNRYSIVIRGDKGAGKSRLLYQLINAFASKNLNVAFLSLEMGLGSSVTQKYKNQYIAQNNLNRIHVSDNTPSFEQLNEICRAYDVVAIDSWTKLNATQANFDLLLRNNPKTIIISIFQSTTNKKVTRGGNMPEYDSAVVIHVHRGGIAECEKNRYAPTNLKYSVFNKKLIEEGVKENG